MQNPGKEIFINCVTPYQSLACFCFKGVNIFKTSYNTQSIYDAVSFHVAVTHTHRLCNCSHLFSLSLTNDFSKIYVKLTLQFFKYIYMDNMYWVIKDLWCNNSFNLNQNRLDTLTGNALMLHWCKNQDCRSKCKGTVDVWNMPLQH